MTLERYEIEYNLRFRGERCFCGAGVGAKAVDRTFVKDAMGRMFVPGTHLKGLARQRCEDLLETLGGEVGDPHDQDRIIDEDELVTRIFGRPAGRNLTCVFSDARVTNSDVQRSVVRQRVRMNRRLGRPENQALFDTEYAVPPVEGPLAATATLWVERSKHLVPPEVTLLCAGLRLVDCLGGDRSTGSGEVEVGISKVVCGERELGLREVIALLESESWLEDATGGGK